MALHYGVLKGKAIERQLASSKNEHFQILVNAMGEKHRIAINVKSQLAPPEVLFYMSENFVHPITDAILKAGLKAGFTKLESIPGGLALDFVRSNLFPISKMKPIAPHTLLAGDDLNQKLDLYVQQAIQDPAALVFAFGDKWGPENDKPDDYFHFKPGNGIHDIHMNQGNSGKYKKDNGVYQDGALMIYLPSRQKWVAMFIAFQVQSFHTDDKTGDPIPGSVLEKPVKIVAALINPTGNDGGKEFVMLLNKGAEPVKIKDWKIVDKNEQADTVDNQILPPHTTLKIHLSGKGAQLNNEGGLITLLDQNSKKIDGVSYTQKQASQEGVIIQF